MLNQENLEKIKREDFAGNKFAQEERDRLVALLPRLTKITDAQVSLLVSYISIVGTLQKLACDETALLDMEKPVETMQKYTKMATDLQKHLGIADLKDEKENQVLKLLRRKQASNQK